MAVYNAPIGNGTLQFNTNDFIVQNDKQLTFLEADSRYSQVNPVNTITGDDPVFTDHVRIGEKSGSSTAGTNVVEIGSDETAISGTAYRKVSLGCDAGVDAARPEGVNIGYKAGRVDSGKYDGTGVGGDGLCVAVGYNSVAYQTTEGSVGVGLFSGAARSGFSTNRSSAVSIGAYSGRTKLGSGSTALGYGSGYGQAYEGGPERPLAPFCVALNGTGTLINFGWDGASRIDALPISERLFITPIRSYSTITQLNPMCYDTTSKEITYD
jgi:hypothetical protein